MVHYLGINCKVCKLQVGDFLWVAKKLSGNECTGERKTLAVGNFGGFKFMTNLLEFYPPKIFIQLIYFGKQPVFYPPKFCAMW